jgi:hypothetical protein
VWIKVSKIADDVRLLRIMSFILPISVGITYLIVSIAKPKHTIVGKYISRFRQKRLSK